MVDRNFSSVPTDQQGVVCKSRRRPQAPNLIYRIFYGVVGHFVHEMKDFLDAPSLCFSRLPTG